MLHDPTPETIVNSYTTGSQNFQQVVALFNGGWVVTWQSDDQDGSSSGIYQQVYNADGTTKGGEIRVNAETDYPQNNPKTVALADGGWVVTWQSYAQDGNFTGIYQQAFNDDGTVNGSESRVNTATLSDQHAQQVTALADGGWIVSWVSEYQQGHVADIYFQAYNSDGSFNGAETRANSWQDGRQHNVQVAGLLGGGWVVTWVSIGQDGDGSGVYQQAYDDQGVQIGQETLVNTYTTSDQMYQQVTALATGGWVVTWASQDQDGSLFGIYQQVYRADGVAKGSESQVNTYTDSYQYNPQVTALESGGWVVTWTSLGEDGESYGVSQQVYGADGAKRGGETRVNTVIEGSQENQPVIALADGGWVVTWIAYGQDGSNYGVYQQAYNDDGTQRGSETRVNTFTDDRQSMPQITALADGGWVVSWSSDGEDGSDSGVYYQRFDVYGQRYGSNHAPDAVDATLVATEDTAYTFATTDFGFADAVDGDTLSKVFIDTLPENGTLTLGGVAVQAGDAIDAADIVSGKLVWLPASNDNGSGIASLTFRVVDDGGTLGGGKDTSDTHTITFDVTAVGDAPTATDKVITLNEDTPAVIRQVDFGFGDVDRDAFSAVVIETVPEKGSLTADGVTVSAGEQISIAAISANKLVYTPPADTHGTRLTHFTFKVVDATGAVSESANRLDFDVRSVNDAPTADDVTVTTQEDQPLTLNATDFGFADSDGNNLAYVTIVELPTGGTLTLDGEGVSDFDSIFAEDIADGKLVWTPATNENGSGIASLRFSVQDDGGTAWGGEDSSDDFTMTFDVTAVNDAPELHYATASTFEDLAVTMDVLTQATDVENDVLRIASASVTSGFGAVKIVGGKLVYDPTKAPNQDIGVGESRMVEVSYTVSDGHGGMAVQTIEITVNGISPDIFRGTASGETLTGSRGGDIIYGLGGDDLINGRTGADEMRGGAGNDIYTVDNIGDSVLEGRGAGTDLVRSSVSFTLGDNVEQLQLTGSAAINGYGNALANIIAGNRNDNDLWGGLGADRLTGGRGADTFIFRDLADSTVIARGRDLITDFSHAQGDQVDLHLIDANENRNGNQAFQLIGTAAFDGHAGTLRLAYVAGQTILQADTDGDRHADFSTVLDHRLALDDSDFRL